MGKTFLPKLIYLCIILSHFQGLIAQNPYYINFDVNNGIPSSEVYDVEIDDLGRVWFSTDRGVCRYDGYDFKVYTTQNGLANNTVFRIIKNKDGQLWFVDLRGTLSYFHEEKFRSVQPNEKIRKIMNSRWIGGLAWGEQSDVYFWRMGRKNPKGVFRYLPEKETIDSAFVEQLSEQFPVLHLEEKSFFKAGNDLIPDTSITGDFFYAQRKGQFYYYQYNEPFLRHYSVSSTNFYSEKNKLKIKDVVECLYFDRKGDLWVGTQNGLLRYFDGDLSRTPEVYFKDLSITNIIQDEEGSFWLTSLEKGVFYIPSFDFLTIRINNTLTSSEKAWSIVGTKDHLFFSTSGKEITAIDSMFRQTTYEVDSPYSRIFWPHSLNGDRVFFGSFEINKNKNGFEFNSSKMYSGQGLLELINGKFLGFGSNGFRVYENSLMKVVSRGLINERTLCAAEQSNKIWIGAMSGLYVIENYEYEQTIKIPLFNGKSEQRINDIKVDGKNNLWIATLGNGLLYRTTDTLLQIAVKDQLNSDLINRIYLQNDSTLWVGTNKGLNQLIYQYDSVFTIKSLKSITSNDGLLDQYINDVEYWKGYIWVASNSGITYFKPSVIESKLDPIPNVYLEQMLVNQQKVSVNKDLTFKYNQNDLWFQFKGIAYDKSINPPFYKYCLQEAGQIDTTWYQTNIPGARFNNLTPGSYSFIAAARNDEKEWSVKPVVIPFEIRPHFMQTVIFKISSISLLLLVLISAYIIRSGQIQRKEQRKQEINIAHLKMKEAELLALRNQMNPHFIFNALNSIQSFIFKKDIRQASYYLSRFSRLMRNGLQYSRLKYITIKEEIDFLKNYLELEQMRHPDKFTVEFNIDEALRENKLYIPALLLQPILENAVKHAFENISYPGRLQLRFKEQNPKASLLIEIEDNGVGYSVQQIKEERGHQSVGLEIIQQQIDLINADGDGIKAMFSIENLAGKFPNKSGTLVTFIIPIKI